MSELINQVIDFLPQSGANEGLQKEKEGCECLFPNSFLMMCRSFRKRAEEELGV